MILLVCFFLLLLLLKMSSESHNTRLGGMKQKLHDFKNEVSIQLPDLSNNFNEKFDSLYKLLRESEGKIKPTLMTLSQRKFNECERFDY